MLLQFGVRWNIVKINGIRWKYINIATLLTSKLARAAAKILSSDDGSTAFKIKAPLSYVRLVYQLSAILLILQFFFFFNREMKPVTLWTCAHTVSITIIPVFTLKNVFTVLLDEDMPEEQSLSSTPFSSH